MKTPKDSLVTMTELVLPQHANALGTVFGGTVMAWIDIAAATAALRHARIQVVTASVDALHFLAPIKVGWIVNIVASVNYCSQKSCEVGVRVSSENPLTGEVFHTATAYLTLVGVDQQGRPCAIPPISPETEEEKKRYAAAQIRRQQRLDLKKKLSEKEDRA